MSREIMYFVKGCVPSDDGTMNLAQVEETNQSCVKIITNSDTNQRKYYIRFNGSKAMNPYSNPGEVNNRNKTRWVWRMVSEELFVMYADFLKTGVQRKVREVERRA